MRTMPLLSQLRMFTFLVMNGRSFSLLDNEADAAADGMPLRLCYESGSLIGVGKYDRDTNRVKPEVVLRVEETE